MTASFFVIRAGLLMVRASLVPVVATGIRWGSPPGSWWIAPVTSRQIT
jgi:hypothetical protein